MDEENGAWLTYAEAGQRLGVSAESVRAKAIRKSWRRQSGNDGKTRVWLTAEQSTPVEQPVNARSTPVRKAIDPALAHALESHIKTLQGENEALKKQRAAAEARLVELDARHAAELAGERARTEKQAAEFVERDARQAADLTAERARTDKAIAAFAALAERLDALAAERATPWWRKLLIRSGAA